MESLLFLKENKEAFSSLGTIFGLVLFGFAVFQYRRAEHWKKSEFAAKLYKDFSHDDACQRAMWMLDWDGRRINFGSDSKPLVEICDYAILKPALRRHGDNEDDGCKQDDTKHDTGTRFTELEARIRDTFDVFLSHLSQFEWAKRNGLVRQDQVYPYLRYWIEMVKGRRQLPKDVAEQFFVYADAYGFEDVKRFFDRWP